MAKVQKSKQQKKGQSTKKQTPRSSKVETEKRVRAVQEWLMLHYAYADIIKQCTQTWGIEERQAKRYISEAYKCFKRMSDIDIEDKRNLHIQSRMKRIRDLDEKHKNTPQGAAVITAIEKDIAKLEGLYVTKVEHSGELEVKDTQVIKLPNGTEINLS